MKLILKLIGKIIKIVGTVILLAILLATILGVYVTFIERNLLIDKNYNISVNENGQDTLRIVQFSDTQLGEYYTIDNLEKVVKNIYLFMGQ